TWDVYRRGVYPRVARALSTATGWIPFSVGDLIAGAALAAVVVAGVRWAVRTRRAGLTRRRAALRGGAAAASVFGWGIALSVAVYGLNLARPPAEAVFDLPTDLDQAQAEAIIDSIGARIDALRSGLPEDERGVVEMSEDLTDLDRHLVPLQAAILERHGLPAVRTGRLKWMTTSPITGRYATGMYLLATGEPTVVRPPYPGLLPSTAAHERAHLSGFAGEDDASFVGVLTTWASDRPEIRYSGWLDLWLALGRGTADRHPGVQRDHRAIWEHFVATTGFEAPVVRRAHDAALKGVGETGIQSYARVVELALRHIAKHGMPADPSDPSERGAPSEPVPQ
ncbi:MAG TPA: DUF3810 family protein, partial [Actinomycetota bacterium]|nr:DUF3810 family protein [Actinomycetota bacterium]